MGRASSPAMRFLQAAVLVVICLTLPIGCGGGEQRDRKPVGRNASSAADDDQGGLVTASSDSAAGPTCGEIIQEVGDKGVAGRRVVLRTVAIRAGFVPGSRPLATPADAGGFKYFAKDGLLVRGNTKQRVTIEVAARWRKRLAVGWGSPAPPAATLEIEPCESRARWVAYAGGFYVNAPVCAPLIVRVGQRDERVKVGVGKRCGPR